MPALARKSRPRWTAPTGPARAPAAPPPDLGPSPHRVVVELRPDPQQPAARVQGARRASTILRLAASGSISPPMFRAALRFVDDLSLASGATRRSAIPLCRASGAATAPEPPMACVLALARVRAASDALKASNGHAVFWWVVVDDRTLAAFAARHHCRDDTASDLLRTALTALGQHYGLIA